MLENLSSRLSRIVKTMRGQARLTEQNTRDMLREVRLALLEADVALPVVRELTARIKEKALGEEVVGNLNPGQALVGVVERELTAVIGGDVPEKDRQINLSVQPPAVILLAGLQGSGKTTSAAKIAKWLKENLKKKVLTVSADVYRPAAIDQLKTVSAQAGADFFESTPDQKPLDIARMALDHAKRHFYDVLIVDTAGRLAIDEAMMQEVSDLADFLNPAETLFVIDAMLGQDAVNTAKQFNDRLDFDGVVLTKLDGDTRGGAAISIRAVVNKPLKFISSGEKMDALQVFHPERMADRILGMGDIVSLVERAQEQYDEQEARRLKKKLVRDQFNFNDFLSQIAQIKKMGNLKDLASMIPGVGKALKNVEISDDVFKQTEAIIQSMTPAERENPSILNGSRKQRIAAGSGTTIQEVNRLLKQFEDTRKMMKTVAGGMPKMMRHGKRR